MIAKVTPKADNPFDDMFSIFPALRPEEPRVYACKIDTEPNHFVCSPDEVEDVFIKLAPEDERECKCEIHHDGETDLDREIDAMFRYFDAGWNAALAEHQLLPGIKELIFSDPATIVFWEDGTKTVVKCDNEPFSEEHGLAMAYMRKLYPSRAAFKNEVAKGRHRMKKEKSEE